MSDLFKPLFLCVAIALTGPAFAQQDAETPPVADEPRTDGLIVDETVDDGVTATGEPYLVSQHGDWELRCIKAPEGQEDPCQLYQLLEDQNGNSVAEINLFNLPDGDQLEAGATIVTPLETLLTQQVRVTVDSGQPKVYPFTFCTTVGCFARVGFTAGDIASFKRGNQATITIVPAQAPDQRVELTVSLSGFTAGFDAVAEVPTRPAGQ